MKFEIESTGERSVLSGAILIYRPQSQHYAGRGQSHATVHTISTVRDVPVMDAGRPLTQKDYSDLIQGLAVKERPEMRWQPDVVLASGQGKMVWWNRATTRSMFFKKSSRNDETFDGQGNCPVPTLVWRAGLHSLYVYAVKGNERPTQDTDLYQAPFFNVWASGEICRGNVDFPSEEHRQDPQAWEKLFFGSRFTHPNFVEKDRLIIGKKPTQFWSEMIKKPRKSFPEERLVHVKLKVRDLLAPDFESKVSNMTAQGEF